MAWVDVDGDCIYYLTPGGLTSPEAVTVLMVHGAGGSSRHSVPMISRLAPQIMPIAVDLPGHGKSAGVVPDSIERVAHLLDRLLVALNISGPVWYIGHSLGGLIGLKFSLLHPERVQGLVLIATAARFTLHPDFLNQAASGAWNLELLKNSFAPEVSDARKQLVLQDLTRMRVGAGSDSLVRWSEEDLRPHLCDIRVPALVVVPDDDVILSPRHGRLLAFMLPNASLLPVRNAGHYVHVEQPGLLASAINHFLQFQLDGPKGNSGPSVGSPTDGADDSPAHVCE